MKADAILGILQAAVLVACGTLIGIIISDLAASEDWLYRWSTLIAGLLAVGAAGVTVLEMRRADQRQHDRHEELIKLSLRAERHRALRTSEYSQSLEDTILPVASDLADDYYRSFLDPQALDPASVAGRFLTLTAYINTHIVLQEGDVCSDLSCRGWR